MGTSFRFFVMVFSILLETPAWAQESTQQTTNAPNTAPAITQDQQFQPIPSLQDVRSPLTTIMNRQRPAAAAGAQPGTAEGTGPLAPGARPVLSGADLQQRIQEFQFQQLQEDLEAQQRERNEFQLFVTQSTGRDLPIFGANLFRNVPGTFAPVETVPVTPDYVIRPVDEIQIRASGQIDVDFNAQGNRDGTINVPKGGVSTVSGIKANDLPAYLKT